ncbi:efflux RND transporter periplasmic adaptor subunit [Roseofilum sp. BLCC_M154]|uniref:Efflux RND transporter periplasmic adaptor subunit n=1 Tax=Roseofilum acuticapitatum BLCC-M154 TaxID=3022444 RepID=A0ABT7AZP6_9CYAN|nr:efflux RND transporter periplasmic adaptor subunit [Roseofilum acuticapitatum]MDJ1172380.1 efflux RND transporter periplasmic adaptor subunit [Roseofilum acuticapitatum BLCC-M154]
MSEKPVSEIDNSSKPTEAQETPMTEEITPEKNEEKKPGLLLGVGIGLAVGALATYAFNTLNRSEPTPVQPVAASQSAEPVQTVTLATVDLARIPRTFTATGTVDAYDLLPVLPQVMDLQIRQVLVDEGDWVEKGQLMVVLDDSVLQTQISQALADVEASRAVVQERQAAVEQAKSALQGALAAKTEAEAGKQQAIASLAQAQAELEQAERDLERSETLATEGAISTQEVDLSRTKTKNAREAVQVAKANVNSANARISSATANVNSAQATISSMTANVNTALAQLQSQQARVEQQKTYLAQTQVTAPSSGRVSERTARVGDLASPQTPLFRIINQGALELELKIPETQLSQVTIGAPVTLTSDADSRINIEGTIREISPLVDANTRQATVKVDLPSSTVLRPGMFLQGSITAQMVQGLVIPAEAIQPQADGNAIVYQVDENNQAIARTVEVGSTLGGDSTQVEIKQGLNLGDRIVVLGAGFINEGDIVRVVDSTALNPTVN